MNFTNRSTDATSFTWDFGDGHSSTDAEPSNTYSNAGTYSVSLTAVGDGGTNTLTLTDFIVVTNPPPPLPVANFVADFTDGLAPLTVNFTNRSTDATSFTWDFGDGHSSTDAEPSNTYSNAGTYSVSLTAVGDGGTNTLTLTDFIVVTNLPPPLPVADFVADFTNGLAPLTVNFTNRSTDATSFTWDFGDGHSSTDAEPSNTYSNAGTYSVSLTAVGDGGTNTLTLTDFIVVTNPPPPLPVANFVSRLHQRLAPLTVNFTNRSTDATSFTWTSAMAIPAPTPSRRTLTATPALIPSR